MWIRSKTSCGKTAIGTNIHTLKTPGNIQKQIRLIQGRKYKTSGHGRARQGWRGALQARWQVAQTVLSIELKFLSDPSFYQFQVFIRPKFLSDPSFFIGPIPDRCLPLSWVTHSCYWDLTDVTLADEDGYSVLVSNLNTAMMVKALVTV